MPEVETEETFTLTFNVDTLKRIIELKDEEILNLTENGKSYTVWKREGKICIEFTEVVVAEFEMSDYAPDNDWRD